MITFLLKTLLFHSLFIALTHCSQIRFVFELARNGAETPTYLPYDNNTTDIFGEHWKGPGEWTNVGKRQQYIWGFKNSLKYIVDNQWLDSYYDPRDFIFYSTDDNSTWQSMYANVLGLFKDGIKQWNSEEQLKHAVPPNKNTYYKTEDKSLGMNVLPDQISIAPVKQFYKNNHVFELETREQCPNLSEFYKTKQWSPEIKTLKEEIISQYGESWCTAINKSNVSNGGISLTSVDWRNDFNWFKNIIETYISEYLEDKITGKFTSVNTESWYKTATNFMNTYSLSYTHNDKGLQKSQNDIALYSMSITFNNIITLMKNKIANDIAGWKDIHSYSSPRYVLYMGKQSSLDAFKQYMTNIKNTFTEWKYDYSSFSSSAKLELLLNKDSEISEDDYSINYYFNDELMYSIQFKELETWFKKYNYTNSQIQKYCGYSKTYQGFDYNIFTSIFLSVLFITWTVWLVNIPNYRKTNRLLSQEIAE